MEGWARDAENMDMQGGLEDGLGEKMCEIFWHSRPVELLLTGDADSDWISRIPEAWP